MEVPTVLRSDVLSAAESGESLDLIFVTADRRRGTGGEIIEVKNWRKVDFDKPKTNGKSHTKTITRKNPNHWENKTINIFNPNNRLQHPISVHFRLIQFFNGKRVVNG
jgi:hypothetical protein